jgi:RING finger/CHY zinc finger protein 1
MKIDYEFVYLIINSVLILISNMSIDTMSDTDAILTSIGIDPIEYHIYCESKRTNHDSSSEESSNSVDSDNSNSSDDELSITDLKLYHKLLKQYDIAPDTNTDSLVTLKSKPNCDHYHNSCKIYCDDCEDFFECVKCHNTSDKIKHRLNAKDIEIIKCIVCDTEQEWKLKCDECDTPFGNVGCSVCKIIDTLDSVDELFHCHKCKICYYGKSSYYEHCNKCNICVNRSKHNKNKDNGIKCKDFSDDKCVICLEELQNSEMLKLLSCGHILHYDCYGLSIKNSNLCPICSKTIYINISDLKEKEDKLEEEQKYGLPSDKIVKIFCRDCESKSDIKFRYAGLKCPDCNMFNTIQI